jgi:hypothetical protein
MDDDMKACMQLARRHKLNGSIETLLARYKTEWNKVSDRRLRELHGAEYKDVLANKKVTMMRMNVENKKPTPERPQGDLKCRLLVQGNLEVRDPDIAKDSPVAMLSTVKQLLAMGSDCGIRWKPAEVKLLKKLAPKNRARRARWLAESGAHNVEGECEPDMLSGPANALIDDVVSVGDIEGAFLNSKEYVDEEDEPRYVGYRPYKGARKQIFQLTGALYGQYDAPIRWYDTFKEWAVNVAGFVVSKNDQALFTHPDTKLRIALHVDDLMTRGHRKHTEQFWNDILKVFPIKHWDIVTVGHPKIFCSKLIQMMIDEDGLQWYSMTQEADIQQFLIDENMFDCRPVLSPMPDKEELYSDTRGVSEKEHKWIRSTVGSMSYFACETRWDIAYEVNRVVQFLTKPTQGTIKAIKRILAYLSSTWDRKWWVPRVLGDFWDLYVDSDHAGEQKAYTNSRTGVIFFLNGCPMHWQSKKQPMTSLSSAAAEIYALSEACKDIRLRWWISEEMLSPVEWPARIKVDNAAGISFQHSTCPSSKLKGIFNLRHNWVQELKDSDQIKAVKVDTARNLADVLTKCLKTHTRTTLFNLLDVETDEVADNFYRQL